MVYNAQSNKFDLVVVGTGFASSFFLKKYLEKAKGQPKILVLERGVRFSHAERLRYKQTNDTYNGISWKTAERAFINGNPDKKWVFDPNFGGSSNCWTGCTPRFMPNDFKLKSKYGVGKDWPIAYEDLVAYYEEAEQIMAVAGPKVTPFPKKNEYPLPPHQLSTVDKILQKAYGELYISQPTARASQAVGNRAACCSSAVCNLCPINAKFTVENTLTPLYEKAEIKVEYGARVYSLDLVGNVARTVLYEVEGERKQAFGDIIALGANAIFNAHILLNAGDKNKNTGRGLCEQAGVYVVLHYHNLSNVGGGSVIPANGFMMYDGNHRKERAGCLIEHHNLPYIRNESGKWRMLSKFKFVYEDIPDDDNRVLPSDDVFLPKVSFKGHSQYTLKAIDRLSEDIENFFSVLPIEKIVKDNYIQKTEAHICSTTQMSEDPNDGVVDANLIHHQYRNLLVLGSGVFPAISPANPTLTLSALSLRAANLL
jgi:choline dehydrogenase-like flavoprotein